MDVEQPDQHCCVEIERITQQGMGQAAEMLSSLLRIPVGINVSGDGSFDCELMAELSPGQQLGVYLAIRGDINGGMLLTLTEESACWMSQHLLRSTSITELLSEPASSTLKEVGNIIASSFLACLDNQLGLRVMPEPPQLKLATITELLGTFRPDDKSRCMVLQTQLVGITESLVQGAIYLFLDPMGLNCLQQRVNGKP